MSGLVIAAPASGSGKTVATLGLLRALARRGMRAAGAKAGPDYIDPGFHAAASGVPSFNLDPWAMRAETLAALVAQSEADAEIVVCEGVMGLFDGGPGGAGSTADLVARTGWPVVLVADVNRQGASAAALLQGFARFRGDVPVAGAIFNRVGSPAHARAIQAEMTRSCPEIRVIGFLPRDPALTLPERHLGLVQAREIESFEAFLERAADTVEAHADVEALMRLGRPARLGYRGNAKAMPLAPLGQRIAVARDDAFTFCYEAVAAGWRAQGTEIVPFSPLAGETPDESCDAVYLPGGYPELHAGKLAASPALRALREAGERGAVIYGECGGYMVLGESLEDAEGNRHKMTGLLPLETSFAKRRLHLGYREAELTEDGVLGAKSAKFRGHEFHYATVTREDKARPLFTCTDAAGEDTGPAGLARGRIAGSFIHLVDRA